MAQSSKTNSSARKDKRAGAEKKTKKALNARLIAGTLIALAVLGPAAYAWRSYQVKRTASSFLSRAETFEEEAYQLVEGLVSPASNTLGKAFEELMAEMDRPEKLEKLREARAKCAKAAGYIQNYSRLRPNENASFGLLARLAETYDLSAGDPSRKLRAIGLYRQAVTAAPADRRLPLHLRLTELLLEVAPYQSVTGLDRAEAAGFALVEMEAGKLLEDYGENPQTERLLALALYGEAQSGVFESKPDEGDSVGEAFEQALGLEVNSENVALSTIHLNLESGEHSAVEINRRNIQLAAILARIYRGEEQLQSSNARELAESKGIKLTELADKIMDDMVAAAPKISDESPAGKRLARKLFATRLLARYEYRARYELPGAEDDLEAALKNEPDSPSVLLAAAVHARAEAERLRKEKGTPDAVRKNLDLALTYFQRAREAAPSNENAYSGLGEVYLAQGKAEEAIKAWQIGLRRCDVKSIRLNSLLAATLTAAGRLEEVEKHLVALDRVARKMAPRWTQSRRLSQQWDNDLLRAKWLVGQGKHRRAIPLLRRVVSGRRSSETEVARTVQASMLLGVAYAALNQPDKAAVAHEEAASLQPGTVEARVAAAAAWMAAGRPELAIRQYELALVSANHPEVQFGLARARYYAQARLPTAQRRWGPFERSLADVKRPEVLGVLNEAWRVAVLEAQYRMTRSGELRRESEGRPAASDTARAAKQKLDDQAKQALDQAREDFPGSAGLFQVLVPFYDALGYQKDADDALATFEKLVTEPVAGCLARSGLLARRGDYPEARRVLEEGMKTCPERFRPVLQARLARNSLAAGQTGQAQSDLQKLVGLHGESPASIRVLCQLAEMALQPSPKNPEPKGTKDKARIWTLKECESKLRKLEGNEGPNVKYFQARRLLAQANTLEEIETVEALQDEIEAGRPEWAAAHLLEGLILERRGRLDQASRAFGNAVAAYNRAIEAYKEAIRLGDRSVTVYGRLIGLVYETRRFDEADQYLTEFQDLGFPLQEATPLETGIAVGLALTAPVTDLRARGEKLDRAIEAARRNVASRPEDALQHTLLANLLFLAGQNALARSQEATGEEAASLKEKASTLKTAAEAKFVDAIQLDPTDLRVHYAQFDYLVRSGQRRSPTESELTDEEKENEPLTAEKKVEDLEKRGGLVRHEQALVVGYMYERLGEREKAEQGYRKADAILQDLDARAPSPKTLALKIVVKKRLAALLSQTDLAKATEVYREINRLQPGSSSAVQSLAAALAVQSIGRYDEEGEKLWEEAQNLLKTAGPESDDPSANQRLRAMVLFQRGGKENLQEAQRLLEQLTADAQRSADVDHLVLARIHEARSTLYRAEGSETEAEEELQRARDQHTSLVARPNPNPSFLLSYIDLLLRSGLHDDALSWRRTFEELAANNADLLASYVGLLLRHGLEEEATRSLKSLEELDGESLRTTRLKARWLDASGKQSEIEPLVEEVASKLLEKMAEASKEERAQTCLQAGNIYSRVKRYELAEPWYRRVVELLPKGYAPLALSLALQGQTTEAIRLANEAAKRDGPLGPAKVLAYVLTQGQPTAEDYQLAEPTLSQAVQENGENPKLLFAVANVWIVQGRTSDAVDLYREVLRLRPKDYRVLNNLATMLSEQPDKRNEALGFIDEAIDVAGPMPALLDTKGTILIHLDRAEEAVHWLEQAISGPQPDPRFVFHLAVARDKIGETGEARSDLQRAKGGDLLGRILTDSDRVFLADLERKYGNAE